MAYLLPRDNEHELCLFCRLSSNIICRNRDCHPFRKRSASLILSKTFFRKQSILDITLFMKSKHVCLENADLRPQTLLGVSKTQTRKTQTLWVSRTLRPKKQNYFFTACSARLASRRVVYYSSKYS